MQHRKNNVASVVERKIVQPIPPDWAHLIHKLRWIGLDEEAKRLELAVSTLPPQERGGVCCGPFSTD